LIKKLLSIIIPAAALILAGCEPFTTSYQRIEDTELRLLDFIYEPADVSPGDTLTLTAVFAGNTGLMDNHIKWWISFDVITDLLGRTTVADSVRLEPVASSKDTIFSPKTRAISFRIPIPEDIVITSPSIPERWVEILPPNIQSAIPPNLAQMTKKELVDLIVHMINFASADTPIDPMILQLFTIPIRVMAQIDAPGRLPHRIISDHSVRYNNRLKKAGVTVDINRNPEIDSIVLYKVKGKDRTSFNPKTETADAAIRLDAPGNPNADVVIEVENGYSYFIEASSGGSLDSTTTMFGMKTQEVHRAEWQFAHDKDEMNGVSHKDYMDFWAVMGAQWSIQPPNDKRLKKFTMWVTVTDEVQNERLRPQGSALREISGRFEYK
jgi:hypothetical protein